MSEIIDIIVKYQSKEASLQQLIKFTLQETIKTEVEKKDLIKSVVQILFKSDIDFLSSSKSRKKERVIMRKYYLFIRYLFLNENVQVVADDLNMSRANLYHHCQILFDEYDYNIATRAIVSQLFDEATVKKLKEKFNKLRRA